MFGVINRYSHYKTNITYFDMRVLLISKYVLLGVSMYSFTNKSAYKVFYKQTCCLIISFA